MSTYETLQYDEDQDYALEFALREGRAMACDGSCDNDYFLSDLTEIDGYYFCEDCLDRMGEE